MTVARTRQQKAARGTADTRRESRSLARERITGLTNRCDGNVAREVWLPRMRSLLAGWQIWRACPTFSTSAHRPLEFEVHTLLLSRV